jgi:hypothetical protein
MKAPEMAKIAALIGRALTHRQDPASVRKDVLILRKSFPRLEYCFEEESAGSKRTWWKLLKGKG